MTAQEFEARDDGWGVLADLPGAPMTWVLILSELTIFGLLLGTCTVPRAMSPVADRPLLCRTRKF